MDCDGLNMKVVMTWLENGFFALERGWGWLRRVRGKNLACLLDMLEWIDGWGWIWVSSLEDVSLGLWITFIPLFFMFWVIFISFSSHCVCYIYIDNYDVNRVFVCSIYFLEVGIHIN
jgi:hypothetical protein